MKAFTRNIALQVIANEHLGFSFGKPERVDENLLSVVLPILRKTSVKRQYITLMETTEVQIADTGAIDKMRFTNNSKDNVFVRSGTILKGSTQERATTRSAVLYPGQVVALDVRCVHSTRGIVAGSPVQHSAITPLAFDKAVYDAGYRPENQSKYWEEVNNVSYTMAMASSESMPRHATLYSSSFGAAVGDGIVDDTQAVQHALDQAQQHRYLKQDDLSSNYAAFSKTFEEVLAKVKFHENQVGLGFLTEQGVQTVELFDVPMSWKAFHQDAVKRLGPDLAKPDTGGVFEYKPDVAIREVKKVLEVGYEENTIYKHKPSNGEPGVTVTGLTNEKFVGEVVEVDDRVIHLVLIKRMN